MTYLPHRSTSSSQSSSFCDEVSSLDLAGVFNRIPALSFEEQQRSTSPRLRCVKP